MGQLSTRRRLWDAHTHVKCRFRGIAWLTRVHSDAQDDDHVNRCNLCRQGSVFSTKKDESRLGVVALRLKSS